MHNTEVIAFSLHLLNVAGWGGSTTSTLCFLTEILGLLF